MLALRRRCIRLFEIFVGLNGTEREGFGGLGCGWFFGGLQVLGCRVVHICQVSSMGGIALVACMTLKWEFSNIYFSLVSCICAVLLFFVSSLHST